MTDKTVVKASVISVSPRSLLAFFMFSLILFLPFRQVWKSLDQTSYRMEQQQHTQAEENTSHILTLLGQDHRNLNLLIEEQLEELSENLVLAFRNLRRAGKPDPFSKAVQQIFDPDSASRSALLDNKASATSRFSSILIQQYQFVPDGRNLDLFQTVFCQGLDSGPREMMEELFSYSNVDYLIERAASPPASLQDKLTRYIPGLSTATVFSVIIRGKLIPIVFNGKPYWLYNQILLDSEKMGDCDQPLSVYPDFIKKYSYLPDTRRKTLLGSIVFLLPRSETPLLTPEDLVRHCSRKGTALALIPSSGLPVASPEFSTPALAPLIQSARLSENPSSTEEKEPDGYSVGRGQALLGQPYRIVVATRHRAPDLWFARKEAVLRAGSFLLFSLILGLLFLSVLRGGALARRLSHQLATGFLLAALMPLALAFDLTEQSFQQRSELLEARYRYLLRERLQEIENLVLLTRQMSRQSISAQVHPSKLLDLINTFSSSTASIVRSHFVQDELDLLYKDFSRDIYSDRTHRISPHRIILAGQGQSWTVPEESKTSQRDSLALFLSFAADNLFEDLYGPPPVQNRLTQEARREIILEEFLSVLASLMDPSSVFFMLKGADDLLSVHSGQGNRYIHRLLIPNASCPTHLMYVFTGRVQEGTAARRIIGAPLKFPGKFFGSRLPQQANQAFPAYGMKYGFVRNVFRSLALNPVLHSMTIAHEGRTLLLEGWPCKYAQGIVLLGFVDREEILKKEFYTQLAQQSLILIAVVIILFLAVHSTQDFLLPVQRLSNGLLALENDNLSVRLPIDRTDELGQLCASFNGLARHLHEGQVLGRMVSGRARKAMKSSTEENQAQEGHRTFATIAYVSLMDADHITHQVDPELFLQGLSHQIGLICKTAAVHGGEADKVMGGKVLLVFGLEDEPDGGGVAGAVRFAADLLSCHAEGKLASVPAIGINYGPVISGLLGSGARRDFTVIGDTVNLAARLSAFGETLNNSRVVLPESALRFLTPRPKVQTLGGTHIKGKSQEVVAVQLLLDET